MIQAILAVAGGLALLLWSAGRFVAGSASAAKHFGMPPLLIGMVVVGFGTSAPELVVSLLSAAGGNPGLALGNAYGSNITNIALILGLSALIRPLSVRSGVLRRELPVLLAVSVFATVQAGDGELTRLDAAILLALFGLLMVWTIIQGKTKGGDALAGEIDGELAQQGLMPLGRALAWLAAGLMLLVASSRLLVWGAVEIAREAGVSDLLIGLTIVAAGTSLPELASSVVAARRGEHDIALGNILGSNLFNTLAVVGVAGAIRPMAVPPGILARDLPAMLALTLSLFVFGFGFRGPGRINRVEGTALLAAFAAYTAYLIATS